jgi:hypothetical protein
MAANTAPIFTRLGDIGQSMTLLTAATTDYTGVSPYVREVYSTDPTNGGFIQKLRFKAKGANVATVARVYINRGGLNTNFALAATAPSGTPSGTGGSMLTGNYYGMIIAIGPGDAQSVIGAFSTVVAVSSATAIGSISWTWTAIPGALKYRLYVSPWATTTTYATYATRYVETITNSYSQTAMIGDIGTFDDPTVGNQFLFGEVSLPLISAASATAGFADIDYQMNLALPPGYKIYVGIATTVASGWICTGIGGTY